MLTYMQYKVCDPLRLSMADTSKLQEQLIDIRKKLTD